MTKSTRDLQRDYNKLKTGKICNKHSRKVRKGRFESYEIVPFDDELGVYPIDFVKGRTEDFCPECRRIEKINPIVNEWQEDASKKNYVKNTSSMLKTKSVILDSTIRKANFENFETLDSETSRLKKEAVLMADEILKGSGNNYLLCGKPGTGKSHLGMAIADKVNKDSYKQHIVDGTIEPFRCIFLSIPEMLKKIYNSYSLPYEQKINYRHTEEEYKKIMRTFDLVVFDDLGAELGRMEGNGATDNMVKLLNTFLEIRLEKATVITSNFDLDQVLKNYDGRLESRLKAGLEGNLLIFNNTSDKRGRRK